MTARYNAITLNAISDLWECAFSTVQIGAKLDIPHGSVCRLIRAARLNGDGRFGARGFISPDGARNPPKVAIVKQKPALAPVIFIHPTVYELKPDDCRYAVTSGESHQHRFCAAPRAADSPYCAEHKARCNAGAYTRRAR